LFFFLFFVFGFTFALTQFSRTESAAAQKVISPVYLPCIYSPHHPF
jgi:hypothetical protein